MQECIPASDVVNEEGTNSTSIVGTSDGSEIFLPCCIPYLKFDIFILYGYGFGTKLNADGDIMGGSGFVFDELKDDAGLANASVTDDYELEQIVIRIHENIIIKRKEGGVNTFYGRWII